MTKTVHVAVGVVEDTQGRILIARRPDHVHQGGVWEFPGGKVDEGEDVITALCRELREEIGIEVNKTSPLLTITHDYGDKHVLLDVHRVSGFQGEPHGLEGQPVRWVNRDDIRNYTFPDANRGIINAILLPDRYMITAKYSNASDYLESISSAVSQGIRLVQFRAGHLEDDNYAQVARQIIAEYGSRVSVVLNSSPEVFEQTQAAGLHLNSRRLMQTSERPVSTSKLLSASVHTLAELSQAMIIGADFIVVSPVKPTASHPGASPLGWEQFVNFVSQANCPVYALGGMKSADLDEVKRLGGQGIAGISLFKSN